MISKYTIMRLLPLMLPKLRTNSFLIFVIVFTPLLNAQETITLTLEKSVDLALRQNPELQIAEKKFLKAKAGVWEAYSTILPQLDAYANLDHAWQIQTSRIPNFIKPMLGPLAGTIPGIDEMPDFVDIAFGLENTLRTGATVTQPLFLGGAGMAGIQAAKASRRASEENLRLQKHSIILESSTAFYSCLLTEELVTVQEEALEQAKANLDVVTKRYNVGTASGFDKMRAEVDVANLEPDVIAARNNYQSALTQLRTILGLDRETQIDISGEFQYQEDEFGNMTLSELQESALSMRPEVKALTEQKYIARKGVTIARSNFLPKLFFQTDYSYLAMRDNLKFGQDDFSTGFSSTLNLQVPLFHGFRNSKQYQKAKLDFKMVMDTEKQLRDGIAAEVEVAYNNLQEAQQKFLSAEKTVALAEEALRLANLMYEEGANTQLDVLSSRLALTRARMSYVTSLFEYQVARYQLRKVTGQLEGVI
jgi:outer membrane protein